MTNLNPPPAFEIAALSLREARVIPEFHLEEIPAPQRLAPYALALEAELNTSPSRVDPDGILAHGRFITLYDPSGQTAWDGEFRVIIYTKAFIEMEMNADPLLGEVAWSWLGEALDYRGCEARALTGTVTRVASESYMGKDIRSEVAELEVRASWSPPEPDLGPSLLAWQDLTCTAAGLEPAQAGVSRLRPPRQSQFFPPSPLRLT